MKVLVDTSVWSLALRRKTGDLNVHERSVTDHLAELVKDDRVALIGPIRQELLSGIRSRTTFDRLRQRLREFDDESLMLEDYETAAEIGNSCRAAGVAGSPNDFLICACAQRRKFEIFTTDRDFARYAAVIPLMLHTWDPMVPDQGR